MIHADNADRMRCRICSRARTARRRPTADEILARQGRLIVSRTSWPTPAAWSSPTSSGSRTSSTSAGTSARSTRSSAKIMRRAYREVAPERRTRRRAAAGRGLRAGDRARCRGRAHARLHLSTTRGPRGAPRGHTLVASRAGPASARTGAGERAHSISGVPRGGLAGASPRSRGSRAAWGQVRRGVRAPGALDQSSRWIVPRHHDLAADAHASPSPRRIGSAHALDDVSRSTPARPRAQRARARRRVLAISASVARGRRPAASTAAT